MPSRRDFIKYLGASGAAALSTKAKANHDSPSSSTKPNVVLVVADQWRASALEMGPSNDNTYQTTQLLQTPHLKSFGETGMRLDRCFATKPVCTPNRSAIITGQYPHETGMFNNNLMLPPDIPCMSDVFNDAGYRTYYVGKWHMDGGGKGTSGSPAAGWVPKNWRRRGLNQWDGMNRGHSYYNGSFMLDDDGSKIPVPTANPSGTLDEQLADFEPHRQVDLVMDYLTDHQANHDGENFFIWLNFGPPHDPFTPPAPFDTYNATSLVARPNNTDSSNMSALANYYGLCTALDYEFKRLSDHLESLGLTEDTIVVFTSDHGEMMGSHGYVRKGQPEDESWRIPFLVRWPQHVPASAVSDTAFSSTDIMPTLLGMCGLDIPDSVSGSDKSQLLYGNSIPDTPVYGENEGNGYSSGWRGIVKKIGGVTYKLILRVNRDVTPNEMYTGELYDLDNDPYELTNQVDNPSFAAIRTDLEDTIDQWRTETGDTYYPAQGTPMASGSYPSTATVNEDLNSKILKKDDGKHYLQVKSQSRIFFTMQESPDMSSGSWTDVGSAKHGNGNLLNFEIGDLGSLTFLGIPKMFYRVKAEESLVTGSTDFIEGGNISGSSSADWSNGAPSSAVPGTIGLDITSGTMGGGLNGQVITQLAGTILINSGTASSQAFDGSTKYTLVGGIFRRTTSHVLRLGQNSNISSVEFNIVGGLLDLSSSAGSTGLVFMGTDSVLNISGGTVDVSGNQIYLHDSSNHTDTAIINFEEESAGDVTCALLKFSSAKLGYINFETGSNGTLTVTDDISDASTGLTFEDLWNSGRLRYMDENTGNFSDHFQVSGSTLSLK
ncbi:Tat (twin-arginine translocation) pathway signal sequence [Rubritalea squalenifaciens DSM 18772]|uniref:Tat (Twin-arginine translocation) pathway signal sequence n=1 Tax=Rubritalea squalenifaciens DSM 18772 TaxID=1123071 RepID=A0A1M6E3M7_9BACT|nr:sulfatase-like hydrolase/transferase [Rubritalea squalenifaciens]SHI80005.1 Tat (twin-arginine translocation) pathway signal sequence [Rubritalea squalenifaciens DSM 18772]